MPFETFEREVRRVCKCKNINVHDIYHSDDIYDPNYGKHIARLAGGIFLIGNSIAKSIEYIAPNRRYRIKFDQFCAVS